MTEHFTFDELARTSYTALQQKNRDFALACIERVRLLAEFAERVRALVRAPMIITSGVRCAELNAAVGGAELSQHTACEAIDFICPPLTPARAYGLIRHSALQFGQLILERNGKTEWVHISIGTKREVFKIKK